MKWLRLILIVMLFVFSFCAIVLAADEAAAEDSGLQSILWTIAGAAVTALAGTGIGVLVSWLKKLKIVKKFNLEHLIDKAADIAINYAESWGRNAAKKGAEKLNVAKEAFQAELDRQGLKLEAGDMNRRLEAIFNKIKDAVEHKEKPPKEEPLPVD